MFTVALLHRNRFGNRHGTFAEIFASKIARQYYGFLGLVFSNSGLKQCKLFMCRRNKCQATIMTVVGFGTTFFNDKYHIALV